MAETRMNKPVPTKYKAINRIIRKKTRKQKLLGIKKMINYVTNILKKCYRLKQNRVFPQS